MFIDETGTNTKMTRPRGRCRKGERLRSKAPFGHWKRQTLIAGLRCHGLTAPFVVDAPMKHTGPTHINQGTLSARDFADMIDSSLNLADDGILQVTSGSTPLTIGGLSGGGEIQLARGIIITKPTGVSPS